MCAARQVIAVLNVMKDAHNLEHNRWSQPVLPRLRHPQHQPLRQRIRVEQIPAHEALVHNHSHRAAQGVPVIQKASADQMHPERVKETRSQRLKIGNRRMLLVDRLPNNGEGELVVPLERYPRRERNVLYARNGAQPLQNLPLVGHDFLWRRSIGTALTGSGARLQPRGQHMIGRHPQVDPAQVPEAVQRQSRSRQQRQRQRKFRSHQNPLRPRAAAPGNGARTLLQRFAQVHASSLPRRRAAKQNTAHQRHSDREAENRNIDPHYGLSRLFGQRQNRHGQLHNRPAQRNADPSSQYREGQAFRQQLPEYLPPRSAHRRAQRQLLLPR